MTTLSTCPEPTCAVTREGEVATCPKCGRPMKVIRESRARGWVLIVCGLVMLGMMVPITLSLAPSLMNPDPDSFTGTAEQARYMLYMFYSLIGFGIACLAGGVVWVAGGRQNRIFTILTFVMLALTILFVWLALRDAKG
jgi:predicted nucleic acid-binding Zn ribbon protein